jgi:hypothetical protein
VVLDGGWPRAAGRRVESGIRATLEVALGVKEEGAKKFGNISVCKSNRQGLREGEWVLL